LILAGHIFIILSRVGVTYKTGFRLNEWIYCNIYIHTTRDCSQYSAVADLHNLQFTVTHALGFSVFISCTQATDIAVSISLQITHEVSFAPPNSRSCQFRRLNSIQFLCSQDHSSAGLRLEARTFTSDSTAVLYL
jgi:hypothetical protein